MQQKKSILALYVLLGIGFVFLAIGITDLKHPVRTSYDCQYLGRGRAVQPIKTRAKVLYSGQRRIDDDIAMQCGNLGTVIVNEFLPLPVNSQGTFELKEKDYRYFPTRYNALIPVVNPQDVQAAGVPNSQS